MSGARVKLPSSAEVEDFSPHLLALQERPPPRLPRLVAGLCMLLFAALLVWAVLGRLDIVASAEGRLVPRNLSRLVQPAEAGVLREVLVREGDAVEAGQLLLRLDATSAAADLRTVDEELLHHRLTLRWIDDELARLGTQPAPAGEVPALPAATGARLLPVVLPAVPPRPAEALSGATRSAAARAAARAESIAPPGGDRALGVPSLSVQAARIAAQYAARRQAHHDALAQERAAQERAAHELSAATRNLEKLQATVPLTRRQADSYERLVREGFVSELGADEKRRERIEHEQALRAQQAAVAALEAALRQSHSRLAQLASHWRRELQDDRAERVTALARLEAEQQKQAYRAALLELRAPVAGTVKDLAAYVPGAVVQPGMVLLNIVPRGEPLMAEVAIRNEDAGVVAAGQPVRLKLRAYPFQKHGLLEGTVELVAAEAAATPAVAMLGTGAAPGAPQALEYRAHVALAAQSLAATDGRSLRLAPGMAVTAEIHQGERSVLEYLLSPVQKVAREAGRER